MTGQPTEPNMMCRVCRSPLDHLTEWVNDEVHVSHQHPAAGDHSHRPDPIPIGGDATPVSVCDFCNDADAPWIHTAHQFGPGVTTNSNVDSAFDPCWRVCESCHDLIIDDRWDDLVDRVLDVVDTPVSPRSKAIATAVVFGFRANRTGPPTRAY